MKREKALVMASAALRKVAHKYAPDAHIYELGDHSAYFEKQYNNYKSLHDAAKTIDGMIKQPELGME